MTNENAPTPATLEKTFPVFVVDDDEAIREALSRGLRKRGYEVECYGSAAAFLAGRVETQAGCLILDHGMPDITGLELQAHLNAHPGALLPIIFITGHGSVPQSVQAMKGGALDFLQKPFRQSELVERIEAAFAILRQGLEHKPTTAPIAQKLAEKLDHLTAREAEIVQLILDYPAHTASKEIAARLGISPRTVDHHRARILDKLNVRSVAELIALAKE